MAGHRLLNHAGSDVCPISDRGLDSIDEGSVPLLRKLARGIRIWTQRALRTARAQEEARWDADRTHQTPEDRERAEAAVRDALRRRDERDPSNGGPTASP